MTGRIIREKVVLHDHAVSRIKERGTTLDEVTATVLGGELFAAKYNRTGFRRNFAFGKEWQSKFYAFKQLEVYAVEEQDYWLVITVIVKYF